MRFASRRVGWMRAERVRRGAWALLAVSAAILCAASALMVALDSRVLGGIALLGMLVAAGSGVAVAASRHIGSARGRGVLSVQDGEVVVASGRRVTRRKLADLADGWIEEPSDVILRWKDGAVLAVDCATEVAADALLAEAGVAATHRALTVRLSSTAAGTHGGVALCVVPILVLAPGALIFVAAVGLGVAELVTQPTGIGFVAVLLCALIVAIPAFFIAFLVDALRAPEAVVGIDGIHLRRFIGSRFIPYRDVHGLAEGPRGVVLHTRRGPLELPTWRAWTPRLDTRGAESTEAWRTRRMLAERIREAKAAGARGSASIEALDRQGRPLAAWRDAVRALGRGKGAYRQAGLGPSELGEVLLDATAPAERRIAAAMALGAAEDPAHRDRVRIAIETCADEELKAALEQVAEDELDETAVAKAIARRR